VPVQTVKQEGTSDVDDEQVRESRRTRKELQPPIALVLAGVGASLRTFKATTSAPIVPQPQGAMVGLGAELAFFPLRLSGRLARSAAGGIFLEGYYRRTLAGMLVHGGAYDGERCNVDDYTVMAGGGYRYVLGGRLPTIGLGVGWATEGTYLYCKTPVLSTQYRSIEVSLKIDQPLIGETLGIELAGGPRFIISKAAKREGAFAAELWLAWRPIGVLFFRAGARINGTWETTAKAAVPVSDLRTFVGLEVGAAF
jgi:hypothetical protein